MDDSGDKRLLRSGRPCEKFPGVYFAAISSAAAGVIGRPEAFNAARISFLASSPGSDMGARMYPTFRPWAVIANFILPIMSGKMSLGPRCMVALTTRKIFQ